MDARDFIDIADLLDAERVSFEEKFLPSLRSVISSATSLHGSWCGSNLGYHSTVYYADFEKPPRGAHFSVETGTDDSLISDTIGDWQEYSPSDVFSEISRRSGNPKLDPCRLEVARLSSLFSRKKGEIISGLSIVLQERQDSFLERLLGQVEKINPVGENELARAFLPSGQFMTRDMRALTGQVKVAAHHQKIAEITALNQPSECCGKLAEIARQIGSHVSRLEKRAKKSAMIGTNIFIGHGRSPDWHILKSFVSERLCLPYDEFNRVPVAGLTNIARLNEMLDSAAFAFLILTSEDEQKDGKQHARMNVIHEVGLFQGRLGFTKAIVLLEEGCEEFSNIQGLGQIRFPKNNIASIFEDIRRVLEREAVLK